MSFSSNPDSVETESSGGVPCKADQEDRIQDRKWWQQSSRKENSEAIFSHNSILPMPLHTPRTPATGAFPLVRAICNALQLAGYSAEIDNDRDIWYGPGDGDRYFDARVYGPKHGSEDPDLWLRDNCPVCHDPVKYGLTETLDEDERSRRP